MGVKLNSSIRLEGEDKILKNFRDFIRDTESGAEKILEEGAEVMKNYAKEKAPGPTGREGGKYPHPPGTLKDSIQVGYVKRGNGRIGIKVGIAKNKYFSGEDKFYARFVEFGHHVVNKKGEVVGEALARPFMRPTLVRTRSKVRKLVIDRLKKEMGL